MIVACGDKNQSRSIKLCQICDEIYDQVESSNSAVLAGYGCSLTEYHLMSVLTRFSMRNPDLALYHRNKNLTSVEALKHQKILHMLECKSLHIVYMFLHQFIWVFHSRTRNTFQTETIENKVDSCTFSIGMLCVKHKQCDHCIMGLKGKKVEKRMTSTMGYGLLACEDIPKDTYIIRYIDKQIFFSIRMIALMSPKLHTKIKGMRMLLSISMSKKQNVLLNMRIIHANLMQCLVK